MSKRKRVIPGKVNVEKLQGGFSPSDIDTGAKMFTTPTGNLKTYARAGVGHAFAQSLV